MPSKSGVGTSVSTTAAMNVMQHAGDTGGHGFPFGLRRPGSGGGVARRATPGRMLASEELGVLVRSVFRLPLLVLL